MWYNKPSGVHYEGQFNKTFMAWLDNKRNVKICEYDENTKLFSNITLLKKWSYRDDHGLPVLHIMKKGRYKGHILVLLNLHNSYLSIRKSTFPERIQEFDKEIIIDSSNITYPSMIESSDGRLILFYKKNVFESSTQRTRNLFYRFSDDGGDSWSVEKELLNFGINSWVYSVPPIVVNDTIRLAFSIKEASSSRVVDLYYLQSPDFGKSWFDDKGHKFFNSNQIIKPIIVTPIGLETRVWDIAIMKGEGPRISFVTYDSSLNKNYVAFYNATSKKWDIYHVGVSKNEFYPGGIVFDCQDPNKIICTEQIENGNLSIVEKTFVAQESRFKKIRYISKNIERNQVRPQIVENYSTIRTMWVESIDYPHYQNFNTNLKIEVVNHSNK